MWFYRKVTQKIGDTLKVKTKTMCNSWPAKIRNLAKQNGFIIVGVCGCTNSGKTTLCDRLSKKFPDSVVVVNQDTFFREEDDPNHKWIELEGNRRHQNWEILECINWKKMCDRIEQIVLKPNRTAKPTLVLIDGHILYNYRPLSQIFDLKYFIRTNDKDLIHQRRILRNYVPADPPGYFDRCVWPMYLNNLDEIKDQPDIHYIDGSWNEDQIFDYVLKDLKKCLAL